MPDPAPATSATDTSPPATNEAEWEQSFTQTPSHQASAVDSSPHSTAEPPVRFALEAAPPQLNPLVEQYRSAGFDVQDGMTADQIAAHALQQLQRIQPYAQYGQSLLPHAELINSALQGGSAPDQPRAAGDEWSEEKYFGDIWKSPQWTEQYDFAINNGIVQRDEAGRFVATPGYEAMAMPILAGLNQAHSWQRDQWQQIMRGNPYESFYRNLREPFQRTWQADIQAEVARHFEAMQTDQRVRTFEEQHQDALYATDAAGRRGLTEYGQKVQSAVQYLRDELGVTDPGKLMDAAQRIAGDPPAPRPLAPPAPTAAAPLAPEQNSTTQKSFLEAALDRAQHSPSSGGAAYQSPDNRGELHQNDLNTLFINKWRSQQGQPAA